jgi:fibronectin-binding autotransporter adhesin
LNGGSLTTGVDNTSTTFGGVISGTGGLIKSGSGTLTLIAANTYTGATTINAGTLSFSSLGNLGNGTAINFGGGRLRWETGNTTDISGRTVTVNAGGATLDVQANTVTFAGAVGNSGSGALAKTGTGTLVLSSANTYTGGTSVDQGTLRVTNAGGLGSGAVTINNGGTLEINGAVTLNKAITLNNGATLYGTSTADSVGTHTIASGAAVTFKTEGSLFDVGDAANDVTGGGGGASITVTGPTNTVNLNQTSDFVGSWIVAAGTLGIDNNANLGNLSNTVTLANGKLSAFGNIGRSITLASGGGNIAVATSLTLSGVISGGGSLTKSGSGTLILTGTATHTGGTVLSGGTLQIGNGGTTGTLAGAITGSNSLKFNRSDPITWGGDIGISGGSVTQTGPGTLTLSGNNTYSGPTIVTGGTLVLSTLAKFGNGTAISLSGGSTMQWASGSTADISARTVTLGSGGATLDVQSNNVTIAGAIGNSGSGSLTKLGSGTLVLGGANTYTGATIVTAGTLQFSTLGNLGNGTGITFSGGILRWASGATTDISARTVRIDSAGGTVDVQSNNVTFAGAIGAGGTGALTKLGTGTLTLAAGNTYSGGTRIDAGTLTLGANHVLADGTQVRVNGGTLDLATRIDFVGEVILESGSIIGTGTLFGQAFNFKSGTVSAKFGDTGGLTKSTSGTVTLTAANSYTGSTYIDSGILDFSALNNFGFSTDIFFNGATLRWASGNSADISSKTVTIDSGGATLDVQSNAVTFSGGIGNGGSGALTKTGTGTLTLAGLNTYTGATEIQAGTLTLSGGGAITATSSVALLSGNMNVNAGATLIVGTGGMTVGTLGVTNAVVNIAGGTVVSNGLFNIRYGGYGTITAGGKLDLTDEKLIFQNGGGQYLGTWNGNSYTELTGMIDSGRGPTGAWNGTGIITSMSDASSGRMLTSLAIALAGDVGYGGTKTFGGASVAANDVLIMYTYDGDANLSGFIDGDDFFRIDAGYATRNNITPLLGYANGDFDYNGRVNADDYWLIDRNYSRQGAPFSAGAATGVASVPEPARMSTVALILMALGRRRRHTWERQCAILTYA